MKEITKLLRKRFLFGMEGQNDYMVAEEEHQPSIILFDGVCNLCNSFVNFVIEHDPKGKFQFAALQSEAGKLLRKAYKFDKFSPDSVILIENNKVYMESTAALRIVRKLSGIWKIYYAYIIIPRFIRDAIYRLIARNRYKWFGTRSTCRMPTPELRSRFLT